MTEIKTVSPVAAFKGTPHLDIDVQLGHPNPHPQRRLEQRIVYALCLHMKANGFLPYCVFDGDEFYRVHKAKDPVKEAMELIFNLDEVSLRFRKDGYREHGVLLVLGNGEDVIADWNYFEDDRDGFDAVMNAFDPYQYA